MPGGAAAEETLRVGDGGVEESLGLKRPIEGFFVGVCKACGSIDGGFFHAAGTSDVAAEGFGSFVARLEVREGPPLGGGRLGASAAWADPPFLFTHFLSFSS